MATYLIIGSNSFSGAYFTNYLLNKRKKVIALSRSNFKKKVLNLNYNLRDKFIFRKFDLNNSENSLNKIFKNFDDELIIINFAAQGMVAESWNNPEDWYETNVLGQVKFIKKIMSMNLNLKKFIHFSTPEVYGSTNKYITECHAFSPSTPYAISRACFDNHLMALYREFDFPSIITRTANVYGPTQDLYRIIPKTFMSILNNKKLTLHGGGKSIRCFIHMKDVCRALDSILDSGLVGETYHISTEESISIYDLVLKITKMMRVEFNDYIVEGVERTGKDHKYLLAINKIKAECKWSPSISLENGLSDCKKWILQNYSSLKKESLNYEHKK